MDDHVLHLRILMASKNNHKDTQQELISFHSQVRTVTLVSASCFLEPSHNPPSNVHPNDGSYPRGYDLPCVLHSSKLMAHVMPSRRSSRNLRISQVHSQSTWHQRLQDFANPSSLLEVKNTGVETQRLEFSCEVYVCKLLQCDPFDLRVCDEIPSIALRISPERWIFCCMASCTHLSFG